MSVMDVGFLAGIFDSYPLYRRQNRVILAGNSHRPKEEAKAAESSAREIKLTIDK